MTARSKDLHFPLRPFAVFIFILTVNPVFSHHPGSDIFPDHASVSSRASGRLDFSNYDHDGFKADIASLGASLEKTLSVKTSVGARTSLNRIDPQTAAKSWGLSDTEIFIKTKLPNLSHDFLWSGGLGLELPTGNKNKGFGSGHAELIPFISLVKHYDDLMLHGGLAAALSLEDEGHGHDAPTAINVINPHEEKEFSGHLGASANISEKIYANAVMSWSWALSGEHKNKFLADARPELGWRLVNDWSISLSLQLPLTEEHYFNSRSSIELRKLL